MPRGGGKFALGGNGGYLGVSLLGSWNITGENDSELTFKNASVGVLFDIASFAYLGGTYSMNLDTSDETSKIEVLVGLGPRLLKALAK